MAQPSRDQSLVNFPNRFILRVAGFALTALIATGGISSAQECSTGMLNGFYDASFHTVRLGILTGSPPTVQAFPTQGLVDGLSVYDFDGMGSLKALAFAQANGQPLSTPANTPHITPDGFAPQTGTYHINPDCTGGGTMSQPGADFTFVIVLGDRGRTFRLVGTSAHFATIPGNPACTNGCDLAIQNAQQGERIFSRNQ